MKVFLSRCHIKLTDEQLASSKPVQSWVQIFRPGKWNHPRYGELQFNNEIFDGFVKNFKDKTRKIELALDQEHQPEKGAAGWFKDLENRGDRSPDQGLWALVEWTKWGLNLVADGVFKYLSGDFDYEWKDEETGKKYDNVLFGAALTNRPFIKGMSPINLSEFKDEIEIRDSFQLAEDILKLKEGKVKTDQEILDCPEDALTPEEKTKKAELMKMKQDEEVMLAKKKQCAERAKKIGLCDTATEEEIAAKEKELAEQINNENEQKVKRALAVGLPADATLEQIEKAEQEAVTKQREMEKNKNLSERAKKIGLSEKSTEEDIVKKEKELAEQETAKMLSDVGSLEKKLSELRDNKGDALTIKLLEETIASKKSLAEEKIKTAKAQIEIKLKEYWRAGKMTTKERDLLKEVLCSDIDGGCASFKLSEKDKDGKEVKATRTLSEIFDAILTDRPAIVELAELAKVELKEPAKEDEGKELSDEKVAETASRVANKVTKQTKTAKRLAEEKKEE